MFVYTRLFYSETGNSNGGIITYGGEKLAYVLEPDTKQGTQSGQRYRIPAGLYNLDFHPSGKYQGYPRLSSAEVPASRGILIHGGNVEAHSAGCLLVGIEGTICQTKSGLQIIKRISTCQPAIGLILKIMNERNVRKLEVRDA